MLRPVTDPEDRALAGLSRLLYALFADPDVVLPLERLQRFLVEPSARAGRQFRVLVAEEGDLVLGGTVFSYVPATRCGFSEYLVARKERHGQGIGRLLVKGRRAELDRQAQTTQGGVCRGLFIEADNPDRTPTELQARERETAMDSVARLRLFAHLGFSRVDVAYVQPPLAPGQQPVTYLDLLFAPWDEQVQREHRVPSAWVAGTLGPIWDSWAADERREHARTLQAELGDLPLDLLPVAQTFGL